MRLWVSDEDRKNIEKAKTIDELLLIAYYILIGMPKPIGMVCGPISTGGTGDRKTNIAAIRSTADRLQRAGKSIFDQTIFDKAFARLETQRAQENPYWLLENFYRQLFTNRFITTLYFLPTWQSSLGARWEHNEGKRLWLKTIHVRE